MGFRCGHVAVVGLPNAGKSSLLNNLLDTPLAIVSPKAQTTRNAISGIVNREQAQIIFVDTPGLILNPDRGLNETLVEAAIETVRAAEVTVYLLDGERTAKSLKVLQDDVEMIKKVSPRLLLLTKADLVSDENREKALDVVRSNFDQPCLWVSSENGAGVHEFLTLLETLLPESPPLYPDDEFTTVTERFIAGEYIREALMNHLQEEVPYACAATIEEFSRREDGTLYIRAVIHVERDSQKGIVIGRGGAAIKEIGRTARLRCEEFWQEKVFLDLNVKVRPKWRRDAVWLDRFGYKYHKER